VAGGRGFDVPPSSVLRLEGLEALDLWAREFAARSNGRA
jgi:hypothetical protein